jgi:hypothetical protein
MIWRVFPLVKINTRIAETPCIVNIKLTLVIFQIQKSVLP